MRKKLRPDDGSGGLAPVSGRTVDGLQEAVLLARDRGDLVEEVAAWSLLSAATATSDTRDEVVARLRRSEAWLRSREPGAALRTTCQLAELALKASKHGEAEAAARRGLRLARRQPGSAPLEGRLLIVLATVVGQAGDSGAALEHLARAERLLERSGTPPERLRCQLLAAHLERSAGELARARGRLLQARSLLQPDAGPERFLLLEAEASQACAEGSAPEATAAGGAALAAAQALAWPSGEGRARYVLGWAAQVAGRLRDAASELRAAVRLASRAGDERAEVAARARLSQVLARAGFGPEAKAESAACDRRCADGGDPVARAAALCRAAEATLEAGEPDAAERAAAEALAVLARRSFGPVAKDASTLRGEALLALGRPGEALDELARACSASPAQGGPPPEPRLRAAAALLALGRPAEARRRLEAVDGLRLPPPEGWLCLKLAERLAVAERRGVDAQALARRLLGALAAAPRELAEAFLRAARRLGLLGPEPLQLTTPEGRAPLSLEARALLDPRTFDVLYDATHQRLWRAGVEVARLPPQRQSARLLRFFLERSGAFFDRQALYEGVWRLPYNREFHDNDVYVAVSKLRRLLEADPRAPRYVVTDLSGRYGLAPGARCALILPEGGGPELRALAG